jgi:hypothetical protein
MKTKIKAKVGETFQIGKYEFIRFPEEQGGVAVVLKDCLFCSKYGEDNNLSKSVILEKLQPVLAEIIDQLGAENVMEFETDLLSLDGSAKHGVLSSKISLPTFDFYRKNVKIFDDYKPDTWWWLATPDSTTDHINNDWIVCVSPRGDVYFVSYDGDISGVRPFLIFSSSIFES